MKGLALALPLSLAANLALAALLYSRPAASPAPAGTPVLEAATDPAKTATEFRASRAAPKPFPKMSPISPACGPAACRRK